ncbi:hypothetical protein D3C83_297640 [compost metagenome]
MRDEFRIDIPVRAVVPRHQDRAGGVPDEQILHLAPAIDEDRVRVLLKELVRLLRFKMLHFRFPLALAGAEL